MYAHIHIYRVLPQNSLFQEIELAGKVTGVIIEENQVVILDSTNCPSLNKKYWDISKIIDIIKQIEKTKNIRRKKDKESDTPLWEKKALVGDEKVSLYIIFLYMYPHKRAYMYVYIV
jgi:hypothetical protein